MAGADERYIRTLAHCWARHRLTVVSPERFPSWDWIILTAASESQAEWYELALEAARGRGLFSPLTRTLVVPDPGGHRIGSGGATLNALRAACARDPQLSQRRILLVHSGGDSRRVPWANVFGKSFIPLPLLADPDHAVPTILDHLVAVASGMVAAFPRGGLVTLSGDMLLLMDPAELPLPAHGAAVVTTPVPLDLASHHGVIAGDDPGRVVRLLQKPTPEEIEAAGALVEGGAALLDTGVWSFGGEALAALIRTATQSPGALDRLLDCGAQCSLYEEIGRAMVPAQRDELRTRDWSAALVEGLRGVELVHCRTDDIVFLHFGTTAEILENFTGSWAGRLTTRILADTGPRVSSDARVYLSQLAPETRIGWGSLVYGCRLSSQAAIGRRCVVVGVDDGGEAFTLPDHTCLWQVPLRNDHGGGLVAACCGVDDHPGAKSGRITFCNRDLDLWLHEHQLTEADLWPDDAPRMIWSARLFPVESEPATLRFASWLAGSGTGPGAEQLRAQWRAAHRISLAELHHEADIARWARRLADLESELVLHALGHTIEAGLDRNVYELVRRLKAPGLRARAASLSDLRRGALAGEGACPRSRCMQIHSDLLRGSGRNDEARRAAEAAFDAVQDEVAEAIRFRPPEPVADRPPARIEVELPVRFDISGGWSDTPPYCLERPALVLNFALRLNGQNPVRVVAETLPVPRWELKVEDLGADGVFESADTAMRTGGVNDPFHLLKTALRITGYGGPSGITQGVRVVTRTCVPKGSGLGTSSILGAALVTALQRLAGRPDDPLTVSDLVLVLEQQMRTGGGWQDQVGGLVPGVKCIRTVPRRPLRLEIEPVPLRPMVREEFERRFVLIFTGQQRLARNILQRVVERYLRRDARTLAAIQELVELAAVGRSALAMGRLDDLGEVLHRAWSALQQLTPECSNPHVDALLREIEPWCVGGKLAGAGGGGFLGVLARDPGAADRIRAHFRQRNPPLQVYEWTLAIE